MKKIGKLAESQKVLIVAIILSFVFGIIFAKDLWDKPIENISNSNNENVKNFDYFYKIKLPLRYFIGEDLGGGSIGDGEYDDTTTWEYSYLGGNDTYHSFPTTTISLEDTKYSNEIRYIPEQTIRNAFLEQHGYDSEAGECRETENEGNALCPRFEEYYDIAIEKYGTYAEHFIGYNKWGYGNEIKLWLLTDIKKFDVDEDGIEESVILLSEGIDFFYKEILVVKENEVIFSLDISKDDYRTITPAKNGNGFYLEWKNISKHFEAGYSAPTGYTKTRFVYENNIFKPVYEQEVLYTKVENIK